MLWLLVSVFCVVQADVARVRLCVTQDLAASCAQMAEDVPQTFACVIATDAFGCLEKLASGEADLANIDPEYVYLREDQLTLHPLLFEEIDGEPFKYEIVALVDKGDQSIRNVPDLKRKRACFNGLRGAFHWDIPITKLLRDRDHSMQITCDDRELASLSCYFRGSCLAGNWSSDPLVDKLLKRSYPSLCTQCKDPASCSDDDQYYGDEGAIKCLTDGYGNVAFTTLSALRHYLAKYPEIAEKVELLCLAGGREERMSVNDEEPCVWGNKLTNAYFISNNHYADTERLTQVMLDTQMRYSVPNARIPEWYYKTFLTHGNASGINASNPFNNKYTDHFRDNYDVIRFDPEYTCEYEEKEKSIVKICITSESEEYKCEKYSIAVNIRGLWPKIHCVKAASKASCMQMLKEGNAELVVLDGGDIYKGGRYYGLKPLAELLYKDTDAACAVAVQRSVSDVTRLSDLKSMRSCHTGIGHTAGWIMPVGALLTEGLLSSEGSACGNHAAAVVDFFSTGSCVPGANDTKYNPERTRSEDLCRHCVGDRQGLHKCDRDSHERFSGYGGAFRCLAEGKGDVAFVRHSTVKEHTDGNSQMDWTKDLISSDFQLLCGEGGTAPVEEYLRCNLGKIPSSHVMIPGKTTMDRRLQLAELLANTAHYYRKFQLFQFFSDSDLLSKDTTTDFKVLPLDVTYEQVIDKRFLEASKAVDPQTCA